MAFGVAASQGALLLAGGEKGMRYAMPNTRVMIHQPQTGCGVWLLNSPLFYKLSVKEKSLDAYWLLGIISFYERIWFCLNTMLQGHVEDVRRQVNEAIESRQVSLSLSLSPSLFIIMLLALRLWKIECLSYKTEFFIACCRKSTRCMQLSLDNHWRKCNSTLKEIVSYLHLR